MPWARALNFTDPFACSHAVQGAEVEILPTATGTFCSEITQVGMNNLWMQRFDFVLPQISTVALDPSRVAIGFLTDAGTPRLQHCGTDIADGDLIVLGFDVLHQRSATGFGFGSMSVPVKDFLVLCKTIVGRELPERQDSRVVRPTSTLMSRLLSLHKVVGQLAHDAPEVLEQPEILRALEEQLIHTMIRCLADSLSVTPSVCELRHNVIMRRFEQFLEANRDRPIYLTEICAAIGVAERTLRASCEEHLGMGPIRYLTLRRMHLARRALQRAEPSNSTVTRIVTDQGFWELGRFSVAYRALFGESPAETLRRPAEQTSIKFNRPMSLAPGPLRRFSPSYISRSAMPASFLQSPNRTNRPSTR
jgi:AraC-like DNA-binding protein